MVDCAAVSAAAELICWAVACNSVAEEETMPTMPPTAASNPSASSTMVRLRSRAAASSARRFISASSNALRATIALMPSTALPTAPISSPRLASAICASISPLAMRCSTATSRPSGRASCMKTKTERRTAMTMLARPPATDVK